MLSSPESDYRESRSAPTVSRDKWTSHASGKLSKGYALIISEGRKNASFFLAGRGYEPCPYVTAKRLVELHIVEATGKHPLGTLYTLTANALEIQAVSKSKDLDDPDPVEELEADGDSGTLMLNALDGLEEESESADSDDDEDEESSAEEDSDDDEDDDED